MHVEKIYKFEKLVSKLHIHSLDIVVWHVLRWYINKRLPKYYMTHPSIEGKLSSDFTDKEVIVSLTTYPKRMETLPIVLESLFRQTVKPTSIQLWLADEQYPDKKELFEKMKPYSERGLEILFCDDLKSHKKYYYAMKNNPEAIVVTVDDDIIYSETMLEMLLLTYKKHMDCIVAHRAHRMIIENKTVLPYNKWSYRAKGEIGPSMYLCATGGAGCLYPPHLISEHVFDKEVFQELCFYADDIWLKCMEKICNIPVVLTDRDNPEIITTLGSNEGGLASSNVEGGKNDQQFRAVTEYYNIKW